MGEKNYIYISCSSADLKKVRPVIKRLEKDGFTVVSSDGAENKIHIKIPSLIKKCDLFLAFVSSNYIKDKDCLDQLDYARNKTAENARLIIYLEEVDLPDSFEMRYGRFQAIYMCRYKKLEDFYKKLYSTEKLRIMKVSQKTPTEEPENKRKIWAAVILFVIIGIAVVVFCVFSATKSKENRVASGRISLGNDIYIDGVYDSYLNSLEATIDLPEKDIAEEFVAMHAFLGRLSIFNSYEVTFRCPSSTVSFSNSETALTNFKEYPEPYVEYLEKVFDDFTASSFIMSVKEWYDKYNDYFDSLGVNADILEASYGNVYKFSENDSHFRLNILYDNESYVRQLYLIGSFTDASDFISALFICSAEMSKWQNIGDKLTITFFLLHENSETPKWIGYYMGDLDWPYPIIIDEDNNIVSLTEQQKAECYTDEKMKYAYYILRDAEIYLKNLKFREE